MKSFGRCSSWHRTMRRIISRQHAYSIAFLETEVGFTRFGFVSLGLTDLSLVLVDMFHNTIVPQLHGTHGHVVGRILPAPRHTPKIL